MTEPGSRSQLSHSRHTGQTVDGVSPIAADGGFGPMDFDDYNDEKSHEGDMHKEPESSTADDVADRIGEDFDDFEAGAEVEDFGDFDEGTGKSPLPGRTFAEPEAEAPPRQSLPAANIPFVSIPVHSQEKALPCPLSWLYHKAAKVYLLATP